jgi:hypothetical protein
MNIRIGKPALAAIVLVLLGIAAYWYWSPFLAMRAMQSAAQAHDAPAFNAYVDYPRVRDSLKGQLAAQLTQPAGTPADAHNPMASLGRMMGVAMVDKLVDAMVRPETVMRAMQSGQFGAPAAPGPATAEAPGAKKKWSWVRVDTGKLIAYPDDGSASPIEQKMQIVFERSGFARWQVTDVRMPSKAG